MSDVTTPLTHTVMFSRKVGLPNYSNQECSIFIQVDADRDETAESQAEKLMAAFATAKIHVLTQLGLPFDTTTEGVVVERGPQLELPAKRDAVTTLRDSFPGATVETNVVPVNFSQGSTVDPLTLDKRSQKQWLVQRFQTHPNEFFDNRGNKKNPKAPDLKHKSSGLGVWLDVG